MFANSQLESARCCFHQVISGFQECSSRYGELRHFLDPEEWKSRCTDRQMWVFFFSLVGLWSETAGAYSPRTEALREVYVKVPLARCHCQDTHQQLELLSVHSWSSSPASLKSGRSHRTARDNKGVICFKRLICSRRHFRDRDG